MGPGNSTVSSDSVILLQYLETNRN